MIFLLRRLLLTIPVVLGVTSLTFFLLHMVPGDPVEIMLGDQATSLDKSALRAELGLDKPLLDQYAGFYRNLAQLNLGTSLRTRQPVSQEILERVPATFELAFSAMMISILIGIPLGTLAGVRPHSWIDRGVRVFSLLGTSTPGFWIGPLLVLIFSVELNLLPVSERGGIENLVLPSVTLAIGLCSVLAQMTRASVRSVIREDYIRVAHAKGAPALRVYFRHALSNALIPIITILGLQFGAVLTGTVIIETIFDWPGIGLLLYQGIVERNYPLVQGCVLFISITYVLVQLLTDMAYATANPKVTLT